MGTGGGEFLLTLNHPYTNTSVTEFYEPNVRLCKDRLEPLGIHVEQIIDNAAIPYQDEQFDIVINRHEEFIVREVRRILKSGGLFIAQQVGKLNMNSISKKVIKDYNRQECGLMLEEAKEELIREGFEILLEEESFTPLRFYDLGAFVYYTKIIEWEFPGFSVENNFEQLLDLMKEIEENGYLEGEEHRFIIVARKGE